MSVSEHLLEVTIRVKIEGDLGRARFLTRTCRFSVLAEDEGKAFQCYLPNPGRLEELLLLLLPGAELLIRRARDRRGHRKTGFDVIGVEIDDQTATIDSRIPNLVMAEAFWLGTLPEFSGYGYVRS